MQDQWATLDWYQYLCLWEQLPQDMKRVAELVGVQERFLARAAGGRVPCETVQQARLLATHKRFYSALVLHDLVNETPLSAAVRKYGCTRGVLQSLQQSASTFAGVKKQLLLQMLRMWVVFKRGFIENICTAPLHDLCSGGRS